jgi:putative ABC transport system permease protein
MISAVDPFHRAFRQADDCPDAPKTVVVTFDVWQREFGGHPAIIGETMNIEGEIFTIVGMRRGLF